MVRTMVEVLKSAGSYTGSYSGIISNARRNKTVPD